MGNMSYCRFHNTEIDLQECIDALNDGERLSYSEKRSAKMLLDRCVEYIEAYEYWEQSCDCDSDSGDDD